MIYKLRDFLNSFKYISILAFPHSTSLLPVIRIVLYPILHPVFHRGGVGRVTLPPLVQCDGEWPCKQPLALGGSALTYSVEIDYITALPSAAVQCLQLNSTAHCLQTENFPLILDLVHSESMNSEQEVDKFAANRWVCMEPLLPWVRLLSASPRRGRGISCPRQTCVACRSPPVPWPPPPGTRRTPPGLNIRKTSGTAEPIS